MVWITRTVWAELSYTWLLSMASHDSSFSSFRLRPTGAMVLTYARVT